MSLLNYYCTDGSAGTPPDANYAPRCMLPQQSKSACETPIGMQDPNLHLGSKFDRAYIVLCTFMYWGLNLHVVAESACGVSICTLGCRFRLLMQIQTQAEQKLMSSKNVHQANHIYSCDTTCHMIVPNTTATGNETLLNIILAV